MKHLGERQWASCDAGDKSYPRGTKIRDKMIPAKTTLKLEYIRRDGYVNTADQVLNSGHLHGCRVVACGVRAGQRGVVEVEENTAPVSV